MVVRVEECGELEMRIFALLLVALAVVGCGKTDKPDDAQGVDSSLASLSPAGGPSEVLADVNGKLLRRGDAETEAAFRLRGVRMPPNPTPAQLATARQRALYHVVDQFITKTLLSDEADKLGLVVTEEEERIAFEKIQEGLPEGQTVEETMNNSPMGRDRMREEVLVGVKIEKLLAQEIGTDFEPSEEEYDAFVSEKGDLLTIPENVKARHILMSTRAATNDATRLEKKTRAEELRKQLLAGADFAELATAHSDCPSRKSGGDLGQFARGRMAPAFEDAAFSQEVGVVGPVVETPYGYHVIQVYEHNAGGPMTQEQITNIVRRQKQGEVRREYVKALIDKARIKLAPTVTPPKQPKW